MAYSPYLSQFMPQMGLLSGMYGGAAGSPGGGVMPNAAPQLPSWSAGGGGMPFTPTMTGPKMPGSEGTQGGAQGANPMQSLLGDKEKMGKLQGLLGGLFGPEGDQNPATNPFINQALPYGGQSAFTSEAARNGLQGLLQGGWGGFGGFGGCA